MIEKLIYFSPLAAIIIGVLCLLRGNRKDSEIRRCFHISRISLVVSFLFSVIFFNRSVVESLTVGNHFTLLCISLMYIGSFLLMFFSEKWFLSMKISAKAFCINVLVAIAAGSLMISSVNLGLTLICVAIELINSVFLLQIGQTKKYEGGRFYLYAVMFCIFLLVFAVFQLYHMDQTLFYEGLRQKIKLYQNSGFTFISVACIMIVLMFLIGFAPLHFWSTELLSSAILPIFTYFMLVPSVACFAGLIHLNIYVFAPLLDKFAFFYTSVALISIGIGAIGSCSGQNIRKMLAYSSLYHQAVVFLILQRFSLGSTVLSTAYYAIYLLTMYGICACLFGLKVKGEYLFMVHEFNGAAHRRPYISAMIVLFLFSLLGFPPLMGFLGTFTTLNDLVGHSHLYQAAYLCFMLLILSYSYLQLVRAIYFEEGKEVFDRADRSIYMVIFLNALIMILLVLQPHYLLNMLTGILGDVFV